MANRLRVGIVGCGGIANQKHLPSLKALNRVDIVAFCDLIIEKAEKSAKEYGTPDAKVYVDYKELLKDESIDVVYVCTPNRMHAQVSIDALDAKKHVMCEKPMAKTAADARAMVEAAKRNGKKLTIGYQHRHKAEARYVKGVVERGDLGEIYYAHAYAIRRRGTPNWGVFLNEYEQGGGPLIDIGTHSLDLTLYLMNNYEPKMVLGKTHKKLEHPEAGNIWGDNGVSSNPLEEAACALIVMKNGATIMLETSWALNIEHPKETTCSLCGTRAGLFVGKELTVNKVDHNRLTLTNVEIGAGGVDFYAGASMKPQEREAAKWIEAIIEDKDPVVLPEQALVVSKILEAIYVSSKTGEAVYFD